MKKSELEFYRSSPLTDASIPYFETGVRAGFPSPVEDIEFSWLDIGLTKIEIESYFVPLGEEHYDAYPIKPFNMTDENTVFERLNTLF